MWEYLAVQVDKLPLEHAVNVELAKGAAAGWELVNGTFDRVYRDSPEVWLFWRRSK